MNQEMLLSENMTIQKKENGLFSIETSITVSTKSIVNISCLIWNPLLRQKLEASVSVSDDLFPHNTPRIVIWIMTGILITVILILIFVIWKLKKVKGVNKEDPIVDKEEPDVYKDEKLMIVDKEEPEDPDVYKDEPVVNKEEPVSYPSVNFENKFDINNDRCGERTNGRIRCKREKITHVPYPTWAGRPLERREWIGMQKWHSPENMPKKEKIIKPFSFSHHEEQQKGDQKKMEGNLSPSPDTLKRPDLKTAQKYRVDVTLDVGRVGPFLLPQIYAKGFLPSSHKTKHKNIGGMETLYYVLGKERFTSRRHYWEVQVENKMKCIVGFCKDSVMRKVWCSIIPETGFWTISLEKGNEYWALSNPPTPLHLEVAPKVVGVFLDYEAGFISFYDVTDDSHIYTFQDIFREALRPCIYLVPS